MDYNPTNNKGIIGVVIEELLVCKRQTVTATNGEQFNNKTLFS
jgi:hypothetical protein